MNIINKIVIILIGILIIIAFVFFKGKEAQEKKDQIIEQKQQIEIQHEIIKDKQIVFKRQTNNIATPINPDIVWLWQNDCANCKN